MFKYLISGFLIATTTFAGLPPTTVKSQNGSASVSFETQAPFNQITKTDAVKALIETGNVNILANPGFEATTGTDSWTASGGTFTATTTFADVGSGVKAGSWDSNSASQTLTSTAVAIPAGDYGANYEVSANLKCASGTCTHLIQAFDGTNVIASQSITSSLTYARTTLNFPAPTSGNISARLVSVASDESTLYIDDVYLGRARNVGSVAQAQLVGTVKVTGCSSGWNTTSASYADFGTQTGCTYSIVGNGLSAPSSNIPGFTISGQPGKYAVVFSGTTGYIGTAGSTQCLYTLSDSSTDSLEENFGGSAQDSAHSTMEFTRIVNNPLTSAVWRVRAKRSAGGGSCLVYGSSSLPGTFKIYRYPLSSEIAYRPEQINKFGSVLFSDSTFRSGGNVTGTTFTTASIASLQSYATYIGSAQACTTNTNVCVRLPQLPAGSWKVTVTGGVVGSNGGDSACMVGVFDGTVRESWFSSGNGSEIYGNGTAYFTYTSQADREFTLQTRKITGAGNCYIGFQNGADASTNNPALRITVEPANPSLLAPNLVGSVTSLSAGSLRIESATITNNGSACATSVSSSSWISGHTRSGGECTSTIATGVFSSTPMCFCTTNGAATASGACAVDNSVSATTVKTVTSALDGTISQTNQDRTLLCIGPRGSL